MLSVVCLHQLSSAHNSSLPRPMSWGILPPLVLPLPLQIGDHLRLVPESQLGHPAHYGDEGEVITVAQIPITLEAVFTAAQLGEPIWFDDGKIGRQIVSNDGNTIDGVITQTPPGGGKLQAEKGLICQRMSSHQDKKRSMLRKLSVSQV